MPRPLLLLLALLACRPAAPSYDRQVLSIPMRDGVTLHAVAMVPHGADAPLPIILHRTPFGADNDLKGPELPPRYREIAADGYLFVTEDVRGRGESGGTFEVMRPLADSTVATATDESTDAWDTIDWLVKHLPDNNGKVAVIGYSLPGWYTAMAAIRPHPALKAISPQAPVTDVWLGDDFFHNGALRQTQVVAYAAWIEGNGFDDGDDEYGWFLRQPTLAALGRAAGVDTLPTWRAVRAHPTWDGYWQARALQRALTRPTVPTLTVGGWWDAEDLYGPQELYRTLEPRDSNHWNSLVFGPWTHGQWTRPGGDSVGPIPLGAPTADAYRQEILRPWLAHWLHGKGDGNFPEARMFEGGGNRWRSFDAWPPKDATARKLYLGADGVLAFEPVAANTRALATWTADPADPVPYAPRTGPGRGWAAWMVQDQRFLEGRKDVASWTSAPLTEDLVIAGDVVAHLVASTSGTDADWVVKLIDVWPDSAAAMPGYQLMVNGEIFRGRYWKGFEQATPLPANTPVSYTIDLHDQLYRFRAGHRLMVQVQSSWFPLYDRNPQRFVPSLFEAGEGDFRKAAQGVLAGSFLEVPVLEGGRAVGR